MRLLLDTHIFIWWNGNVNLLSSAVRSLCDDENNTLVLSVASLWEMQIKNQLGKLNFERPLPEVIASQQRANGLELLPVTAAHVFAIQDLPAHHRDPFDRLLIAQAKTENLTLVTADGAFQKYDVELVFQK